jgi:small subunit ribosomal protein S20
MPIIKSAKKRVKVARKATIRNSKTKRSLKTAVKAFQAKSTDENRRKAQSALDQAGKKNVMHKNKVARKQRQLAKQAKAAGVKLGKATKSPAKPVAKKPLTKKTTTKKAPAKKK